MNQPATKAPLLCLIAAIGRGSHRHLRSLLVGLCAALPATAAIAQDVVETRIGRAAAAPKRDRYGDPLPESALLRLGTTRLRQAGGCACVELSPDGKLLASAGEHSVRIWDVANGAMIRELPHEARSAAFSPDGKSIAFAGDEGLLRVWDPHSGKERIARKGKLDATGSPPRIRAVAFAPDGSWIATAAEGIVTLHDAASGEEILTLRHDDTRAARWCRVVVSPTGKVVASLFKDSIRIWNIEAGGAPVVIEKAHERDVTTLTFSPDGKTLVSAGYRSRAAPGKPGQRERLQRIASIRTWDAETGRRTGELPDEAIDQWINGLSFTADGKTLVATMSTEVRFLDWPSGKVRKSLAPGDRLRDFSGGTASLSRDGKMLALATAGGAVQLWDLATGKQRLAVGESHVARIEAVDFSPDGRMVATGSGDGHVRLWDAATGAHLRRLVYSGSSRNLRAVKFSPDGRTVAATGHPHEEAAGGAVKLWKVETGELLHVFRFPGCGYALSFSPDGKGLAMGPMYDSVAPDDEPGSGAPIRLFDLAAGKEIAKLTGHTETVRAVAYSADGRQLISIGEDRSLRVWNVKTHKQEREIKVNPATGAAISRDASLAVISSWHPKQTESWNIAEGTSLQAFDHADERVGLEGLALSPDKRFVASNGKATVRGNVFVSDSIRLWTVAEGRESHSFPCPDGTVLSLAFSPDGRKLVTGQLNGTALIWDVSAAYDKLSEPAEKQP
jgi:WD40 repeat protein